MQDKNVHSGDHIWRQEWATDGALYPGGTPHNKLYGEAPRERGTFFRLQVYKRAEISLAEVYERVGKCVISVSKKAQGLGSRSRVYLSYSKKTYFA